MQGLFEPQAGTRYDMPAVFGSSRLPAVTKMREVRSITIPFVTDAASLRKLVPYHFDLAPDPLVYVGGGMNMGVDHMGGRDYGVVRVMVDVIAYDANGPFRAPYHLVIWESEAAPIIAGREFQGYAKIFGQIPEHTFEQGELSFQVAEYGTRLMRGGVRDLVDVPDAELAQMNAKGKTVMVGWKYIPGPGNVADVDYATKLITRTTIVSAKRGVGEFVLDRPTEQECPGSARILEVLRQLPVLEVRPALCTVGSFELHRDAVERLPSRA